MEVQTKKQNYSTELMDGRKRLCKHLIYKNIKELLITKLCIITSDKLCKF